MHKPEWKVARIFLWWSVVITAVASLLTGSGALALRSIVGLLIFGGVGATLACWEHGWFKAPVGLGTPLKTIIVLILIWGPLAALGWWASPEPKPEPKPEPTPPKRAHLHVDSFEFLKPIPGKPISINIFYRNDGDADMLDQHIYAAIVRTAPASAPDNEKYVEDNLWDRFSKNSRQKPTSTHKIPARRHGIMDNSARRNTGQLANPETEKWKVHYLVYG